MILLEKHLYYMEIAYIQAKKAYDNDEIPIGSVLVQKNKIIGLGHNQTQLLNDATAHSEILTITQASAKLQSKYLEGATLYCTIEPCLMCFGAILNAQISELIYGAAEPKMGFTKFINELPRKITIQKGILETECKELIELFFKNKRSKY